MRFILLILSLLLSTCYSQVTTKCKQTGPCTCQSSTSVIDLTHLASKTGTPAFHEVSDASGQQYLSWNPCVPFTQDKCENAAVCVREANATPSSIIGTQGSAMFTEDEFGALILVYSSPHRKVTIGLQCSNFVENLWVDDKDALQKGHYNMTLSSRHACWTNLSPVVSDPPVSNKTLTMPTPGSITVTSGPSDLQTVTLLLSIEVLATILILVVIVTVLLAYLTRKLRHNPRRVLPPAYEQLTMEDEYMVKL